MLTVIHRKDCKYPMVIYNQDHHALEISNRIYIYAIGLDEPNYPVPAIPVRVGWQPTGKNDCQNIPYFWICSRDMLWTAWKDLGIYIEHV